MSLTTKEMLKLMHNEFRQIMNTQLDEFRKLNNYVRAQQDKITELDERVCKAERKLYHLQEAGLF